ncbi:hypothetical protein A3Q34_19580 [Colwellia sp. PAMC 20917]|uniref:sensor domain-containing diguanylate cyclase n=1 Tax=Colwellia sp. PAMC 20917 TaxID=1816218 RepID=UPI0008789CBA|nr:GGDEF domain-containing protein [Colwellia sp. PAMC 20917]AOW77620.1 hypothetical protein A3Q34_12605 [Colwellia sp. PAMC 20917]AOW78848.1 hypothetical protein A3Q34_19580 [Colwellia sp. PAMC 20917]
MDEVDFFNNALDALPEHICIINNIGDIVFVNQAWVDFELNNSSTQSTDWHKINYFDICKNSISEDNDDISLILSGIEAVASQNSPSFSFEYPCHSPDNHRWFSLNCTPFKSNQKTYTLLQHVNITQKKQADINSNIDALTGVANRRAFDEFFQKEWLRCARSLSPISLIIIDIDDFKAFNDTYGHVKGDWCLKTICNELKQLVNRPSDLFCRYGGEEFIYVLGNTSSKQAQEICTKIHQVLKELNIKRDAIKDSIRVTVSAGLACVHPSNFNNKIDLLEYADKYLYTAKSQGKNTTRCHYCESEICSPKNCSY